MRVLTFVDVLKNDTNEKCSQRSSNPFSAEIKFSSGSGTQRQSSLTRAESDNNSNRLSTKRGLGKIKDNKLKMGNRKINNSYKNLQIPEFKLEGGCPTKIKRNLGYP